LLLTLHATAFFGMGLRVGFAEFWNWVMLLLLADLVWLAYDPAVRPRWLLWMIEGFRRGFPSRVEPFELPWRPSYPPRAWVSINLVTAALLALAFCLPVHSEESSAVAFSTVCLVNAVADWAATKWWLVAT